MVLELRGSLPLCSLPPINTTPLPVGDGTKEDQNKDTPRGNFGPEIENQYIEKIYQYYTTYSYL